MKLEQTLEKHIVFLEVIMATLQLNTGKMTAIGFSLV